MSYSVDETSVIYADLDPSEGIVLHLQTKNYYRLNETGQIVWQGVHAGKSIDEIASQVVETYEIDLDEARRDVRALLDQMISENLIRDAESVTESQDRQIARRKR